MKVTDFDFSLPKDLIALSPVKERDRSRLLVLHKDGMLEHKRFSDITAYLTPGDMLLMNNTKVFPARLTGLKQTGGKLDILLVRERGDNVWDVLSRGNYTGILKITENLEAALHNGKIAYFQCSGNLMNTIWKYGNMPLPPYIRRLPDESDKERYQTVYAKQEGSIAAPTAGLHFTEGLLKEIKAKGVTIRELTLHIGIGTFKPILTSNVEAHCMDKEYFEIDKKLISEMKETKASGKRVVTVGTTTTRAIEGYMSGRYTNNTNPPSPPLLKRGKGGLLGSKFISGTTDIFIYPGYQFRAIDSLITNFHLPKSTPLMLTSALCGWEKLKNAYEEAIARRYRFFSYGDAMLFL
ncbi:MAG: tRNA preQ1(34) S-adenosylmethionine ribosyltransferase-isomerase QueA [Nitrospira sp.]|nr:tRNA preQ1(34) S-adenosylmethionine ribosyltransferase-isomerase QueA [Nitrospira sp.]